MLVVIGDKVKVGLLIDFYDDMKKVLFVNFK